MNKREQAKQQAAVMLAYADGAEIETGSKYKTDGSYWDNNSPNWEWGKCDYRVKQNGSDRVRELLKQGKPVLCGVSNHSQENADSNGSKLPSSWARITGHNGRVFTRYATSHKFASPVDLSQFAQENEDD